ncbi:MAG TPA: hypothetical protein IGS52_11345 [Oscillatoriaceae cyanobacterium M33_DOE_052]|uniref:Uncharacterized protein n=1 Tax=Planktothricoides sp. SpSt-374 TaxID=2282167 RepID=A0A7C3VQE3_9CYAN|nr:hypothetical protein [Oscillatoriaceae cyanobacterium M33_DOE_052]
MPTNPRSPSLTGSILPYVGAKHSGESSISQNREFIIGMLRPTLSGCHALDAPSVTLPIPGR